MVCDLAMYTTTNLSRPQDIQGWDEPMATVSQTVTPAIAMADSQWRLDLPERIQPRRSEQSTFWSNTFTISIGAILP
jgi:hypothetical protein